MALFGRRRVPVRVPKAKINEAIDTAREWWEVEAPTAELARALCLKWPKLVKDGDARITNHYRNRG